LEDYQEDWTLSVHPKYRPIGLSNKLVEESLPLQGRRQIEMIAVMAQYKPFAEKTGSKLIML